MSIRGIRKQNDAFLLVFKIAEIAANHAFLYEKAARHENLAT